MLLFETKGKVLYQDSYLYYQQPYIKHFMNQKAGSSECDNVCTCVRKLQPLFTARKQVHLAEYFIIPIMAF